MVLGYEQYTQPKNPFVEENLKNLPKSFSKGKSFGELYQRVNGIYVVFENFRKPLTARFKLFYAFLGPGECLETIFGRFRPMWGPEMGFFQPKFDNSTKFSPISA